jgi:translation initiation factor 1
MPFTFDGNWIPTPKQYPPIKVFKEKRKGSEITVLKNLPMEADELKVLVSQIKKHLATGGTIKGDCVEFQGDKLDLLIRFLKEKGFKIPGK